MFWYEFVRGSIKIQEGCKVVVGHGKDSEEELGKQCDDVLMVGYLTDKQINKKENTALTYSPLLRRLRITFDFRISVYIDDFG